MPLVIPVNPIMSYIFGLIKLLHFFRIVYSSPTWDLHIFLCFCTKVMVYHPLECLEFL